MTVKTIKVAEATEAELRQFAVETLGLPAIHHAAKPESIRAKIAAVYDKDEFTMTVKDVPATPAANVILPANLTLEEIARLPQEQRDQYFVTVTIPKGDTPDKQQPVPISVNGRSMWIERGKQQPIRWPYFHILQNATQIVYHQDAAGNLIPENVPSYPHQIHGWGIPEKKAA